MEKQAEVIQQARNAFTSGKTRDVSFRKKQLQALLRMYDENETVFISALAKDLNKPKQEGVLLELNMLKDDVRHVINHIDEWAEPTKIATNLVTLFDTPKIFNDPYGLVLIMGAWNYPLQLGLLPMSGAIAGGNCVILKPSEVSSATAEAIQSLVPKYLDQDCYHVICGGIPETTALLKHKFDYIFYTGSPQVGKIVREAANKHLTPTTLELGGKSPLYIDDTVDMSLAIRRIMWGKCINLGQTCVAPDYVLCTKQVQEKFVTAAKDVLKEWYGDNPEKSPDLCRIISDRHVSRLVEYLKDGKAVVGGQVNKSTKYIAPTILVDVSPNSKVMTDEIFGPILPIINVDSAYEAMNFINKREKPLALYVFSNEATINQLFLKEVPCGGCTVNDTIFHAAVHGLPFGGVGNSGMGAYHGKASFDTFTHKKSCLIRNYNKIADYIGSNRFPPYSQKKMSVLSSMLKERWMPSLKYLPHVICFALGIATTYAIKGIAKTMGEDD